MDQVSVKRSNKIPAVIKADCDVSPVVAMTETGDVKQSLPVSEQSNLWERLTKAFDSGRGSVRVQVVYHNGQEMAVDMKTLHGSSL